MDHAPAAARTRIPALDGLRGLAVAGVLLFHLGYGWAGGGFLGVSAFFTLSGFFICSLLIEEHEATGRIDLGRFWSRRARRLLPAALLALMIALVFGATVATASQAAGVRGDVLGALAYVANWRFFAAGHGYTGLFAAPSPVLHFWSLSIEEQCYVVLPLMVAGAFALGRGRRSAVGAVLGVALVASLAALVSTYHPGGDISRAYFGTDTRAAELLVGALLAVAVGAAGPVGTTSRRRQTTGTLVGGVALAGVLWSWHAIDLQDARLYRGGLLLHAVAVAAVIVAARAGGPVARMLEVRPLRWLGRISYGAYLYHWPIFLWLTPARTGLVEPWSSALRLALTFAAAGLSARVVEDPVRTGRAFVRSAPRLALAGMAAVATAAAVTPTARHAPSVVYEASTPAPPLPAPAAEDEPTAAITPATVLAAVHTPAPHALPVVDLANAGADGPGAVAAPVAAAPAATIPPAAAGPTYRRLRADEAPRIYVAGDSTALVFGGALATWGARHDAQVWAAGWMACPVARGGVYRYAGIEKQTAANCNEWATRRETDLRGIRPHVVVVSAGVFDVLDRRLPNSDRWQHVGEPAYDEFLRNELAAFTELMASRRAHVVWLVQPDVETGVTEDGTRPLVPFPESDPRRMARLDELIRQVVDAHPGVQLLDLKAHLAGWPGGELDRQLRPDGVHASPAGAEDVAEWLGPQLLALAGV